MCGSVASVPTLGAEPAPAAALATSATAAAATAIHGLRLAARRLRKPGMPSVIASVEHCKSDVVSGGTTDLIRAQTCAGHGRPRLTEELVLVIDPDAKTVTPAASSFTVSAIPDGNVVTESLSAHTSLTWRVTLSQGQSLQPLKDGSVAVVMGDMEDPTLAAPPPPDPALSWNSEDDPVEVDPTDPGAAADPAPALTDPALVAAAQDTTIYPDGDSVPPAVDGPGLVDDAAGLTTSDVVAVIAPPTARDDNGSSVSATLTIAGPDTVRVCVSARTTAVATTAIGFNPDYTPTG